MRFHLDVTRAALVVAFCATLSWPQDTLAQSAPVQGIPIDDQLTIQKCGGCHQRDSNGMMRRLSYIRTSPEVWEQAITRMIRLNGLSITPSEVRDVRIDSHEGCLRRGAWKILPHDVHVDDPCVSARGRSERGVLFERRRAACTELTVASRSSVSVIRHR